MTIYTKEDPQTIQKMFGKIAKHYDKANSILSFNLHKWWNSKLVQQIEHFNMIDPFLDLCCGTGEIAFTFLKKSKIPREVYLIDFCDEMLKCAKEKAHHLKLHAHQISYVHADVTQLSFADQSVGSAAMAYGIRNVKDTLQSLSEIYRVLKPGGHLAILELTQPSHPFLLRLHNFYLHYVLPFLGQYLTSNAEAYSYLSQSIQSFIKPSDLQGLLMRAGFNQTRLIPLTFGIATIVIAEKTSF